MRIDNILTFAVLCVFYDWTLGVDSKMVHLRQPGLNSPIPLDMVPNSVDDMYNGCTEQMNNTVQNKFLSIETKTVGIFKRAWKKAEECVKNVKERFKKDNSEVNLKDKLSGEHIQAICVYTEVSNYIYREFNQAVRTNRTDYGSSFQFHSLHFLLIDALRLLKENQHGCHTTYRRTSMVFAGEVNQIIRFGFFASSSLDKEITKKFGDDSCFEIKTCAGAYLKSYPVLGEQEKEVLIPPFEMFKITKKGKGENVLNCKSLFKLESVGLQSNLNCKAALENTAVKLSVSQ
ncbi:erythroblast NAD(P)(+)--arginine ADP-ribosyltransferase-like [Salvelinus namaycush]|uniref:NAD(P)(+)--arginine ADP-ribosyltransferase n=1 Tax=Salvelinus namaycush TaxID=8040 RepID=A0A8U0Q7U0_SALNM|nr:erythroblast NAD(P)(+)--arginine ADP-ribosyltransferase-like [Salvelinus namaycush]